MSFHSERICAFYSANLHDPDPDWLNEYMDRADSTTWDLLCEIKRATMGFTPHRTARRTNRLKGMVADIPPAYDPTPDFLTLS
jgi:hypothetical protein